MDYSAFETILRFATWTCQAICLFLVSLFVCRKCLDATEAPYNEVQRITRYPLLFRQVCLPLLWETRLKPNHGVDSTLYRSCARTHSDTKVHRHSRNIPRSYQRNNSGTRRSWKTQSHLSKSVGWSRQARFDSSDSSHGNTKTAEGRITGEKQEWTKVAGILVQWYIGAHWL